ncbi:glycosyl-4,4'-diaponeurosporenoate acyltransferase CrtO family protein [Anatilimnocola floriformis]|uniref:glycosyl-4,4'-diaponeurosporenoate acyltransferase CrtO family protein n=1 Tax=Anatilimnocola floriformis TaxID=2948575 RepID=UPI0036F36EAA
MNFAEGAHLVGGVITLALALGYAATGHARVGFTFAIITLLVHFYPLITQRWNRGRVARIVAARRKVNRGTEC